MFKRIDLCSDLVRSVSLPLKYVCSPPFKPPHFLSHIPPSFLYAFFPSSVPPSLSFFPSLHIFLSLLTSFFPSLSHLLFSSSFLPHRFIFSFLLYFNFFLLSIILPFPIFLFPLLSPPVSVSSFHLSLLLFLILYFLIFFLVTLFPFFPSLLPSFFSF